MQYPFSQMDVAVLCVAGRRGLNLKDVDFFFGGSVLGMLATRKTIAQDIYLCTRVVGLPKVVMVTKRKDYV
jgi:hypothetical protein